MESIAFEGYVSPRDENLATIMPGENAENMTNALIDSIKDILPRRVDNVCQ